MKYHDSICNCHSFFKKICPHHLQFNIAITYFIFQGSKRFLSKTKFFRKNSIHELDFISRMLVFSFLSYFLLMKRKIKINRNRSILCTKYFLSLLLFLSPQENISYFRWFPLSKSIHCSKLLTNGRKSPRGTGRGKVERILAREFFVFDSQIHREDSWASSHRSDKKGRNGEINSDPGQNGRLESHYLAITVQNTHPIPSPLIQQCEM